MSETPKNKLYTKLTIRIIIAVAVLILGIYALFSENPILPMLGWLLITVGIFLVLSCHASIKYMRDTEPLLCECGQRVEYHDGVTCTPIDSYKERKQDGNLGNITITTRTTYLITHSCPQCGKQRKYHDSHISHKEITNFAGVHIEGRSYDMEEKNLQGFFKTIRTKKEIE